MRRRTRNSARLDHSDSSHAHSRSEPSCEDHTAAARYSAGVVRLEVSATVLKVKSLRRNATSSTANATVRIPASAYTERRPDSHSSGRPRRAPYNEAPMPYAHTASASSRHVCPSAAIRAYVGGWRRSARAPLGGFASSRAVLADAAGCQQVRNCGGFGAWGGPLILARTVLSSVRTSVQRRS